MGTGMSMVWVLLLLMYMVLIGMMLGDVFG